MLKRWPVATKGRITGLMAHRGGRSKGPGGFLVVQYY